MAVPPQIPLDLAPTPDFSFNRFECGLSNQLAITAITAWPDWPAPILALSGPAGVGKTHLGHAWATQVGAIVLDGAEISVMDPAWAGHLLFIDNADQAPDAILFAILNLALNGDSPSILLAAQQSPKQWDATLPDLVSRLSNLQVFVLGEHEDELLEPILRKLFEDAGRDVARNVVLYIINNCDRSVATLRVLVAELDHAARAQKKDLNKAFVARYLKGR